MTILMLGCSDELGDFDFYQDFKMSEHGGKRKGAGRPKGARSRLTEQAILKAGEGMTPLEFMLDVLRNEENEFDVRMDAAKAAAPYVHARLASVDQTVTHKQDASDYSRAELLAIAKGSGEGAAATRPSARKLN